MFLNLGHGMLFVEPWFLRSLGNGFTWRAIHYTWRVHHAVHFLLVPSRKVRDVSLDAGGRASVVELVTILSSAEVQFEMGNVS